MAEHNELLSTPRAWFQFHPICSLINDTRTTRDKFQIEFPKHIDCLTTEQLSRERLIICRELAATQDRRFIEVAFDTPRFTGDGDNYYAFVTSAMCIALKVKAYLFFHILCERFPQAMDDFGTCLKLKLQRPLEIAIQKDDIAAAIVMLDNGSQGYLLTTAKQQPLVNSVRSSEMAELLTSYGGARIFDTHRIVQDLMDLDRSEVVNTVLHITNGSWYATYTMHYRVKFRFSEEESFEIRKRAHFTRSLVHRLIVELNRQFITAAYRRFTLL